MFIILLFSVVSVNYMFIVLSELSRPVCFIHSLGSCNISLHISQLIRDSKTCCSYYDFLYKGLLLTRKLLNQGFLLVKLKAIFRKFYGRRYDLYGISIFTNHHGYVSFVVIPILSFPHLWQIIEFITKVTRRPNCGVGTAYLSGALEYIPVFSGFRAGHVIFSFLLCCRSLFVLLSFVLTCTSIFTVSDYISPLASPNNSYCGFTTHLFYQTCLEIRHRIYMLFIYAWDETPNVRRNKGFKDLQSSRLFGWDKHSIR